LSKSVRRILNEGGLADVTIFASGGLDEEVLHEILAAGAPIDGFGIGTSFTTSSDSPALDCAYKLQEYAGTPRRKRSTGKATWPGRKQVWRAFDAYGRMSGDTISVDDDPQRGEPLLRPFMREGLRIAPPTSLAQSRERAARNLTQLPEHLRDLETEFAYPVAISQRLIELAEETDRRQAAIAEAGS
jgi:nicotinate phosphoribosyltransferase